MKVCRQLGVAIVTAMLLAGTTGAEEKAEADPAPEKEKSVARKKDKDYPKALDFEMETLSGKKVHLGEKYEGKVVMFVNVASKCGLTPQYEQLQAIYDKYHKKGFEIVAVPCNQFRGQEPGSAKEIREFCTANYGVKFDMLAKVNVNGDEACDLYKFLTSKKMNPKHAGEISWNFEKFIVSRDGEVIERFAPRVKPDAKEVLASLEQELKKKPAKKEKS